MNIRIASVIFGLLILAVAASWCALPEPSGSAAPANAVHVETSDTTTADSSIAACAVIFGFLISGAAAIGIMFFGPCTPKGSRTSGTLSAVVTATTDFTSTWITRRACPERHRPHTAGPERDLRGTEPVRPEYPERPLGLFVERARRGLADRHQELEVVLGLLQTVDQQIDRLVRVQAGQYATQLVQHRRLVRAEQ